MKKLSIVSIALIAFLFCGCNTQKQVNYVTKYIAKDAPGGKEHIGYIIDRTGFMEFKKYALEGVELSDKAILKNNVYWSGVRY